MSSIKGHVQLTGAKNFRDFGGYATNSGTNVKSGILFRADGLWALTDEDLAVLKPLGIRTIYDLRRGQELERSPSRWLPEAATTFYHLPLFQDNSKVGTGSVLSRAQASNSAEASRQIMLDVYKNMVLDPFAVSQIQRYFHLLIQHQHSPMLVHCSGGKDRTGVLCALTLTLLGVDFKDVLEDYMHSLTLYSERIDRTQQSSGQVYDTSRSGEVSAEALRPVYMVDPDYLNVAFDAINKSYNGIDRFFTEQLSLSQADIERFREAMTDVTP